MPDRQVIVQLGTDGTITQGSNRLDGKGKVQSEIVVIHAGTGVGELSMFKYADVRALTAAFSNLTTNSRVYVRGHGDWVNQCIETYDAETVALLLAKAKMPSVQVVSVTGCELARDEGGNASPTAPGNTRLTNSINSFCGKLHAALKRRGITTVVHGRVFDVYVKKNGSKQTFPDDDTELNPQHQMNRSKVVFSWNGNTQHRAWAY